MTTQIVGRDVLFYQKINIYSQIHNDLQYDNAIEALLLFSNNEHTTLSAAVFTFCHNYIPITMPH